MVYSVKNYTWLKDWLELLPDFNKKGIPLEVVLIINYFLLRMAIHIESLKEFQCYFHNALKFSKFFPGILFEESPPPLFSVDKRAVKGHIIIVHLI